jgi:hypothetical protein
VPRVKSIQQRDELFELLGVTIELDRTVRNALLGLNRHRHYGIE